MKQMNKIDFFEDDIEKRLDHFLLDIFPNLSRNKIQKHIKNGDILVNGQVVKTGYLLKEDDIITSIPIEEQPNKQYNLEKVNLNLEILYEDEDLLVVNKPKGLVVHPAQSYDGVTLVNGLLYQVDKLSSINGESRPGILHRLDKDTSGLLIVAKSDKAHVKLAEDISKHKVVRKYYAICYGTFEESSGTINMPIKRDEHNRLKMAVDENGKYAVTHFKVLEQYKNHSLLEVELETGRTHQIRVHMAKINHPLLGDPTYGPKNVFGNSGQYLHAYKLSFMHPIKNRQIDVETDLPIYFKEIIKDLT